MKVDFLSVTIRPHKDGGWEVMQDGKTAGSLCFGEMLELVVKLTNPGTPGPIYAMKTQAEWDAKFNQGEKE